MEIKRDVLDTEKKHSVRSIIGPALLGLFALLLSKWLTAVFPNCKNFVKFTSVCSFDGLASPCQMGTNMVIDTTKMLKKVLKYDDNTQLPSNDNLFLSVVATAVDERNLGGSVGTFSFVHQVTFEDN